MNILGIFSAVEAALRLLAWALPALAKALDGLLMLVARIRQPGMTESRPETIAEAARLLERAVAAAREHLPAVQNLDFGTGNPIAEKMLKLHEIGIAVETRLRAEGFPINTTIGVTAAQLAFAEARSTDPDFGK